ncbi:sugar kinase [Opacimonas viscosa]|uniref:Sugar kinase n=1 Tax=Opacimonas viscosa TaxID=2961944 RepID=A0AA41X493_9ALTE|nr:sugar kinase [Opacimonas viscosa]MCP3429193.1 sugar kinase [Opacimonas viscosa]
MKSIYFLGECMVELKPTEPGLLKQSFAGDVFNSAVYLKRTFKDIKTGFTSVMGTDNLSRQMFDVLLEEGIDTNTIYTNPERTLGLYYIETDHTGERSFTYWRNQSAARTIVKYLDDSALTVLGEADYVFVSGISLAVIAPEQRELFWQKLELLKDQGVAIIFDPNYRARLWASEDEAKAQFTKALEFADIVMPGVEDFTALYDIHTAEALLEFCKPFQIQEIIIKNGPGVVISHYAGETQQHTITPVKNVVDTTSAGDAFNGVYLGARLSGQSIADAVVIAAKAAGTVIQFPGAIIPAQDYANVMLG